MTNLLTVQGKMEKAAKKLQDMTDNKEAEAKLARFFSVHGWPRSLKKVEAFSTRLIALHDRLADLKAYFDGERLDEDSKFDQTSLGLARFWSLIQEGG